MADDKPLKVSYCTTCKGRLEHINQTLPANIEAERDNPNVEFVVLDYDSDDGLGDWIRENFSAEIQTGRLRYARYAPAPHFQMAHAKNMAHRLATGDILCNLDADNFLAADFSQWLTEKFTSNPNFFVSCHALTIDKKIKNLISKNEPSIRGLAGRIAISRDNFNLLRGYDEKFSGWGLDDLNFGLRARELGLEQVKLTPDIWGKAIAHEDEDRLTSLSDSDRAHSKRSLEKPKTTKLLNNMLYVLSHPHPITNTNGQAGCGAVYVNFADSVTIIEPLEPHSPQEIKTPTAWRNWFLAQKKAGRIQ